MLLRKSLFAVAISCLGVIAVPAQSKADTTIQIIEGTITTSGGVATFTPSGTPGSTASIDLGTISPPGASISPSLTTNNFSVLGTIGLNIVGNSISLSTALTLSLSPTETGTQGLEVIVTDPDLMQTNAGAPATFTNDASGTFAGGTVSVAGSTTIAGTTTPQSNSPTNITNGNVSNLPSPFTITQTLLINVSPASSGASSFTSGISTVVNTNSAPTATPAPGGLALALVGLPLIGLRRAFRRKTEKPISC
jgi:hypothetical protein